MKARLALVAAILAALFCMAQSPMSAFPPGIFDNKGAQAPAPPVYIGPGDSSVTPNAAFWGSCARAYSAAYAASLGNMCLLYGVTTATTCQEVANPSGFADWNSALSCVGGTTTVNAFCTTPINSSCNVKTVDDQSGAGIFTSPPTQLNVTNMPGLVLSGLNSLPTLNCGAASSTVLISGSTTTLAQPITHNVVYIITTSGSAKTMIANTSGNVLINSFATTNELTLSAGTALHPTATDNVWHSISANFSGSSGAYNIDGTDTASQNMGTNTYSATSLSICSQKGNSAEFGVWQGTNALTSATLRNTLFNNQNSAAYGYNGLL